MGPFPLLCRAGPGSIRPARPFFARVRAAREPGREGEQGSVPSRCHCPCVRVRVPACLRACVPAWPLFLPVGRLSPSLLSSIAKYHAVRKLPICGWICRCIGLANGGQCDCEKSTPRPNSWKDPLPKPPIPPSCHVISAFCVSVSSRVKSSRQLSITHRRRDIDIDIGRAQLRRHLPCVLAPLSLLPTWSSPTAISSVRLSFWKSAMRQARVSFFHPPPPSSRPQEHVPRCYGGMPWRHAP